MLIKAGHSILLLIDLQERLAPAIRDIDAVLRHNLWLVAVAQRLGVPVAATVQYPAGLGPMVPELTARIPAADVVEKIHFSAVADGCLEALSGFSRRQVVLTGTEAHVCVLQTALGLLELGKEVFVVAEAVGSRVRIMDNKKGQDTTYPGVEVLPDGTIVTTTYGHWTEGEEAYVVSVRFNLSELDAKLGKR